MIRVVFLTGAAILFLFSPVSAAEAVFAGGCFWCMEKPFESLKGVSAVESGYAGGHLENPTYKEVSRGGTGHIEVVRVTYDPAKVSYRKLLDIFWVNIDPFDPAGQFCDKGSQYRSAIFVASEQERELAQKSLDNVAEKFGREVATEILPAARFYPAEEYHQDYYKKNEWRYGIYRAGCGRDNRLKELWGKKAGIEEKP